MSNRELDPPTNHHDLRDLIDGLSDEERQTLNVLLQHQPSRTGIIITEKGVNEAGHKVIVNAEIFDLDQIHEALEKP